MIRTTTLGLTVLVLAIAGCAPHAGPARAGPDAKRGEYLVRELGACGDCHSARDQTGQFVESQWLNGASLTFTSTVPVPAWAPVAMPIAGLPTFRTDQEAVEFLMTGKLAGNRQTRPPMPAYRLHRDDAEDIVAYLRSLRPKS